MTEWKPEQYNPEQCDHCLLYRVHNTVPETITDEEYIPLDAYCAATCRGSSALTVFSPIMTEVLGEDGASEVLREWVRDRVLQTYERLLSWKDLADKIRSNMRREEAQSRSVMRGIESRLAA